MTINLQGTQDTSISLVSIDGNFILLQRYNMHWEKCFPNLIENFTIYLEFSTIYSESEWIAEISGHNYLLQIPTNLIK